MTPKQFRFLELFNEALYEFLKVHYWELAPARVKNNPVERFIKMILKECSGRSYPQIFWHNQIKIEGCRLKIIYISLWKTYLTGNWIIVSQGRKTIAFHFIFNGFLKVWLDVHFESDPLLNKYFKRSIAITADGYIDYIQLKYFNKPRIASLIPPYRAKKASKESFTDALNLIMQLSTDIFCHSKRTVEQDG